MSKVRGQFDRIVVAIYGSQTSMNATQYAIEMARKDDAQLIVLTVNRLLLSSYGITTPQGESESLKEKEDSLVFIWQSIFM